MTELMAGTGPLPAAPVTTAPVRTAPIRTALVGFGLSGRVFHAPVLAADERFSLDVIVTGNPERAAAAAQRYPDARVVSTREEMFAAAAELDLTVVATPAHSHVGLAAGGIEHGLHIVVDKPFVVDPTEGRALHAQAAAAGVVLTVYQKQQWDADFLALQKMVANGSFGRVHTFESRLDRWSAQCRQAQQSKQSSARAANAEGLFFDLGTRVVDQAKELFGPVDEISADSARHSMAAGAQTGEGGYVCMQHSSGVRSRLHMHRSGPRFRVLGSGPSYTKWGLEGQAPVPAAGILPLGTERETEADLSWRRAGRDGDVQPVNQRQNANSNFYTMLADALLKGAAVPADPAEPLKVLQIMEDLRGSN